MLGDRATLVTAVLLAITACKFDEASYTGAPGQPAQLGEADAGLDCPGYEDGSCSDCGMWVCTDRGSGPEVICQPEPALRPCAQGWSCTADATCYHYGEPEPECDWGGGETYRVCGGADNCGREYCLPDGTWSGECEPTDSACGADGTCSEEFECVDVAPVCDTTGYQAPCQIGDDPIDPIVDVGTTWSTSDGCPVLSCRTCQCVGPDGGGSSISCTGCALKD